MGAFFAIVLSLLAIFLVLLVLVQRGRGGGLAGALGGMGGSSAFGAKAGDVFTRITIITASIWIAVCLLALFWAKHGSDALDKPGSAAATDAALDMLPQSPRAEGGGDAAPSAAELESVPANSAAPTSEPAAPPADSQ
jgi:preprotein translocase subunit SecG